MLGIHHIVLARFLARTLTTVAPAGTSKDASQQKNPLRAIDLAKKIRQGKVKIDNAAVAQLSPLESRVSELKQFTLQLQNIHPNVLAKHLYKSLLFQNKDIVVINKPYGVPMQAGPGIKNNITSVLPILAKMIDGMKVESQLHPCLGLEKDTTGTLLLARTEVVDDYIKGLYKNHQVEKKYWVVTLGVPVPSEGIIDIPIIEREVTGSQPHFKMALSPAYRVNDEREGVIRVRNHRQALDAVTKYRVMESSNGCSLVEIQPITGVKHQLRVHMAFALGCPILGDHKYSNWSKLAPQRLPENVLKNLGLEQSKVRYLPLHLHARQLTLKEFKGPTDITVSSPLPRFFVRTLRQLQLTVSHQKEKK